MSVNWEGLEAWRRAFLASPAALVSAARPVLDQAAARTASDLLAAYPRRSGALADGVSMTPTGGTAWRPSATVRSAAPYARVYEQGSSVRSTRRGANRGIMPAAHVLVPSAQRARARMIDGLLDVLRDQGYTVTR